MRYYDPTTGRYIQADPLGLVDGASVYGYALQNPGRWTDFKGETVCLFFPKACGMPSPSEALQELFRQEQVCAAPEGTTLYRAVSPAELAAIMANQGRFSLLVGGLEMKYFTTFYPAAESYALTVLSKGWENGPMTILSTTYPGDVEVSGVDPTPFGPVPIVTLGPIDLALLTPAQVEGTVP